MNEDPDSLAGLAGSLADLAASITVPAFRRTDLGVETKRDASPVTEVDRAVEGALRRAIHDARPEDGILGEEQAPHEGRSGITWVIDPIDGTRAFISGRPMFVTLIAALDEAGPLVGVIDQPVLRERWIGRRGAATTCNGRPVATRKDRSLAGAVWSATSPAMFEGDLAPRFDRLRHAAGTMAFGGDGYAYGLLASGAQDMVVDATMSLWDYAALIPVVEGAGGRITDWEGRPLRAGSDGTVLACAHAAMHEEALDALSG